MGRTNEEYGRYGGERKNVKERRPAWHYAAFVLVFLLSAELGLLLMGIQQFKSLGHFEELPIVQKPADGGELKTPPSGLEPAQGDNGGEGDDEELGEIDLGEGKTSVYARKPIDPDVINILVLGLDTRKPGGNGRSDMNIIVSIDTKRGTIKLVSLLRDTLVPIEGHDWNRLNTAYVFGGPGLAINTVNEVYDMDIQRYVKLDFFAIKDIIDAVGGVDIKLSDKEITNLRNQGLNISEGAGVKHLNGEVALAYARIRKIDGDFQRSQRQRNVMTAALAKARKMGVVKALDLMTKLLPQVKTNVDTNDAITLARQVLGMGGEMGQLTLPVKGSYEGKSYKKMSILSVDFKTNKAALREFLYGGR